MSAPKRIYFTYNSDFPNYKIGEEGSISVWLERRDGTVEDVTCHPNTKIYSLDSDFISVGIPNNNCAPLFFNKEGSAIIKSFYEENGRKFFTAKQFVCHGTFFKDNYLDYFFSSFEKQKITQFKRVRIMFDTLMEMVDILYAYNEDLKVIPNFSDGKSKFMSLMSQNLGIERIDFTDLNSAYEQPSSEIWKELTGNLLDLLSIRGTTLAYELFFGALGYNISIQEFWYDEDGFLIDINPFDESLSTFFRYREDGSLVDDPPVPRPDPRRFVSPSNPPNVNNRSNIVRVIISSSKNTDFAPEPSTFSPEKRRIISSYLEFLRPSHIQYIKEALGGLNNIDEIDSFTERFFFGEIFRFESSEDNPNHPLNEDVKFFSDIAQEYETFVIGTVKSMIVESFGGTTRWDDPALKWDQGLRWDSKAFLVDNMSVNLIAV